MKKTLFILFVLALAVPVFAGFDISVFGGYTSVNLKTLNNDIDETYVAWAPSSPDEIIYRVKFGNALNVGFDAMYSFVPGFSAGLRYELIRADRAGVDWTNHGVTPNDNWKMLWDASLMPVMLGVSYKYEFPKSPLSIGASAFGGWGFGSVRRSLERFGGNYMEWVDYAGGAPTADLTANVSYKLDGITVSFQAGYRLANIQKMRNTDYVNPGYGYWPSNGAGAEFTDYNYATQRNFDFSGLIAGIKFGFSI